MKRTIHIVKNIKGFFFHCVFDCLFINRVEPGNNDCKYIFLNPR